MHIKNLSWVHAEKQAGRQAGRCGIIVMQRMLSAAAAYCAMLLKITWMNSLTTTVGELGQAIIHSLSITTQHATVFTWHVHGQVFRYQAVPVYWYNTGQACLAGVKPGVYVHLCWVESTTVWVWSHGKWHSIALKWTSSRSSRFYHHKIWLPDNMTEDIRWATTTTIYQLQRLIATNHSSRKRMKQSKKRKKSRFLDFEKKT